MIKKADIAGRKNAIIYRKVICLKDSLLGRDCLIPEEKQLFEEIIALCEPADEPVEDSTSREPKANAYQFNFYNNAVVNLDPHANPSNSEYNSGQPDRKYLTTSTKSKRVTAPSKNNGNNRIPQIMVNKHNPAKEKLLSPEHSIIHNTRNNLNKSGVLPKLDLLESLISKIEIIQAIMVNVSTGGQRIKEREREYSRLFQQIQQGLIELNEQGFPLNNPNIFANLGDFYGYWQLHLPTYQSRRKYISNLYGELLTALQDLIHKTKRPPKVSSPYDIEASPREFVKNNALQSPRIAPIESLTWEQTFQMGLGKLTVTELKCIYQAISILKHDKLLHLFNDLETKLKKGELKPASRVFSKFLKDYQQVTNMLNKSVGVSFPSDIDIQLEEIAHAFQNNNEAE